MGEEYSAHSLKVHSVVVEKSVRHQEVRGMLMLRVQTRTRDRKVLALKLLSPFYYIWNPSA